MPAATTPVPQVVKVEQTNPEAWAGVAGIDKGEDNQTSAAG
jgi:hypothetical protein